eukprot:733061-Pyramimonas_sp.AAC.1
MHVVLMAPFDMYKPKHRVIDHLIDRTSWFGSPSLCSCWVDEALNETLKASCKNCGHHTFESGVLLRMRMLLQPKSRGKRFRP